MKRFALFAACLALSSCGASQPLIGTGSCNGHACPGQESAGAALTGSSATGAAASTGTTLSGNALSASTGAGLPAATGAATPSASSEASAAGASVPTGIAVGEPNPSAPAASGEALPAAPAAGSGAPWTFPATMPAHKAQWLETPLATPDDITARINAEGGWRYWHTLRNLPDGTKYFFVVGPTEKPDQAGWYADFQLPAVSGSGAWLVSVLLETTPAKPQAYAGLADMYRGLLKSGGIPAGVPLDTFKAASESVQARIAAE